MKIEKESFISIFESSFWNKLNDSIVPFDDKPIDKLRFLESLHKDISELSYTPSNPREYLVFNKHCGISRYVPTFSRKDYCIYFLCAKLLENEIAVNRVDGTYGGWTLGNPIRLKEEQEIIELEYVPFNTLNALSWTDEWQSFQSIVKKYKDEEEYSCFVMMDVANFYDTINLSILERKIRHTIPKNKQDVVTLLMHFLQNWNRKLEGYNLKNIGIPQDEIGDCSRILANYYLQDFDLYMKNICDKCNAKYVRFADDQVIFAKNKGDAEKILFEASKELFKINLNINSGKVHWFTSKQEFEQYWAFDIYENLEDKNNADKINQAVRRYYSNIDNKLFFRQPSVLKKIINVDFKIIDPIYKYRLMSDFYNPDFLATSGLWYFRKVREKINNDEEFFGKLDTIVESVIFNSFLYQLLFFYKKDRKDFDTKRIEEKIAMLKT